MKKFIVANIGIAVFVVLIGCATGPQPIPEGCEDSLIYKYVPNPRQADLLLRTSYIASMDMGLFDSASFFRIIDAVQEKVNEPNMSYSVLSAFVGYEAMPYVDLLGEWLGMFSTVTSPLHPCDIKSFNYHLDRARRMIQARVDG
jgi:hypothetical protein